VKQVLGKSVLTLIACCVAFGVVYGTVRQASGEGGTGGEATPRSAPTAAPDSGSGAVPAGTATPDAGLTPPPVETAVTGSSPPIDQLGEQAKAGTVFERWGVRLNIPEGLGDFRVIYPIIVDGPGVEVWGNNVIMTVYNIQTHSSVFLGFEETSDGVRVVERGRHIEQAEVNAALDQLTSSAEVSAQ